MVTIQCTERWVAFHLYSEVRCFFCVLRALCLNWVWASLHPSIQAETWDAKARIDRRFRRLKECNATMFWFACGWFVLISLLAGSSSCSPARPKKVCVCGRDEGWFDDSTNLKMCRFSLHQQLFRHSLCQAESLARRVWPAWEAWENPHVPRLWRPLSRHRSYEGNVLARLPVSISFGGYEVVRLGPGFV